MEYMIIANLLTLGEVACIVAILNRCYAPQWLQIIVGTMAGYLFMIWGWSNL
ncbi:hypothetical protein [Desulfotomaculum defluvii]